MADMVIAMESEEEFEFDFDEDEEELDEETPVAKKKSEKKKSSKKKTIEKEKEPEKNNGEKKAKRVPIPEGVKKRMRKDMKELSRLKDELSNLEHEKDSFQKEFELLEDELEHLRSEKENIEGELNNKLAIVNALEKKLDRNQKDFDNFKKRNESEMERKIKMGSKKLILGIIDVLDNLDRALTEAKKNEWKSSVKQLVDGIESIKKGMLKVLHENGVDVMDPEGHVFDPNYHEAIGMVEDKSIPENTVVEVEVKGYSMDGLVLRAAKVKVSKGGKPRPKTVKKEIKKSSKDEKNEEMDEMESVDDVDEELEEIEELVDNLEVKD
jgi:molecular chaperone GrpE